MERVNKPFLILFKTDSPGGKPHDTRILSERDSNHFEVFCGVVEQVALQRWKQFILLVKGSNLSR